MSHIPLFDILAEKRNPIKEVHLIWFEQCNLSCTFCHQDHDSVVGMDRVVQSTVDAISKLDPAFKYKINLSGGELFHDGIPDNIFEDYFTSSMMILDKLPFADIYFGSNLVYNPDRFVKLLQRLSDAGVDDRIHISTSYDPAGRFNSGDLEIFLNNLEHPEIRKRMSSINVVITKQNIDSIVGGRHKEILDSLYGNFHIYFDHFMANNEYILYQPTEERITEFFLYVLEHYPQSGPIKGMVESSDVQLTCQSTIIFTDDGKMVTCWGEAGKDNTKDYDEGLLRKNRAEQDFIEHYGCLSCEFYQRCSMRCFLHHRSLDERPSECQIKLLYQKL